MDLPPYGVSWLPWMAAVVPLIGVVHARWGGCGGSRWHGQPDASPVGKGEQVMVDYFGDQRPGLRRSMGNLGRPMRAIYGATSPDRDATGLSSFSSIMRRM